MRNIVHTIFSFKSRFRNKMPGIVVLVNGSIGIIVVILAMGAISIIAKTIVKRVATVREKLVLLRAVEQRQTIFINLNNDYMRLRTVFPSVYSIIPLPENVIGFSDEVDIIARATGNIAVLQFDTQEPTPDLLLPNVAKVQFSIALQGAGESFKNFLLRMLSSRYIHTIDTVSIDSPDGIYGAGKMLLRGRVYVKSDLQ